MNPSDLRRELFSMVGIPVKKSEQAELDEKIAATPERLLSRSARRQPKITVHAISDADPKFETLEKSLAHEVAMSGGLMSGGSITANHGSPVLPKTNRPNPHSWILSYERASDLVFELMNAALMLRSLPNQGDSYESVTDAIQQKIELDLDLPNSPESLVEKLRMLIELLNRGEIGIVRSDGKTDSVAGRKLAHAFHSVLGAASSRERVEHAVEQSTQKAIYHFAYGLSHEINNPLANIAARAQQLIANAATDNDKRSLATIVDQAMRAHEMLSEMMRVVQPRPISKQLENVISIVRDTVNCHTQNWTHAKIRCDLRLSVAPLFGNVERASLSEAIASLLQNAMQVCRPNDRVEVFCGEATTDQGKWIRIAVRDTGPGLSVESAERAWDLYYSGREHGRGLGISLANVRRIIDAHGGKVWLDSSPNAGCSVEIRLPKMPEPARRKTLLV